MYVKNRLDRTWNSFQIWNFHVNFMKCGNLRTFEYKYKVIFSSMYIFLALKPIVLGDLGHWVMRIPSSLSTKHHAEGLGSSQCSSALAYFSLWFTHWPNFGLVVLGRWLIGPRKSINVCNLQEDSGSDPPLGRSQRESSLWGRLFSHSHRDLFRSLKEAISEEMDLSPFKRKVVSEWGGVRIVTTSVLSEQSVLFPG